MPQKGRRAVLWVLFGGGALLAVPRFGFAQKMRRVGFLVSGARPASKDDRALYEAFLDEMRVLGYIEGRDFAVEWRYGENQRARLGSLAEELVKLGCDVIVTRGPPANRAAKRATDAVPIVVATSADPQEEGLVAGTLARPGGNITGFSTGAAEYVNKHFDLITTAVPGLSRLAILRNPLSPSHPSQIKLLQELSQSRSIRVQVADARARDDFEQAFAAMGGARAEAVIILGDTMFSQNAGRIAALALKHRLPSIYAVDYAENGGLLTFGPSFPAIFRRAAHYVDRVLKGTRPGDLPFEQPTRFDLVINLKTARALGLTIPPSLLVIADRTVD